MDIECITLPNMYIGKISMPMDEKSLPEGYLPCDGTTYTLSGNRYFAQIDSDIVINEEEVKLLS